jgi:hypothetical protein
MRFYGGEGMVDKSYSLHGRKEAQRSGEGWDKK